VEQSKKHESAMHEKLAMRTHNGLNMGHVVSNVVKVFVQEAGYVK